MTSSAKTAVTWEKSLRERKRMYSEPLMPASVVSTGQVTCFSISKGESVGATVLNSTWLLLISGTKSSQPCRTGKARIREIRSGLPQSSPASDLRSSALRMKELATAMVAPDFSPETTS